MNAPDNDSTLPNNPADDAGAAEAKPKRKRAPRKTAADSAEPASVGGAAEGAPSQAAVFASDALGAPEAQTPVRAAHGEPEGSGAAAQSGGARGAEQAGEEHGAGHEEGSAEGSAEGEGPGGRRSRNRRRGRRGGDKTQQDGSVEGAVAAATPQAEEVFAQVMSGEFDVDEPGLAIGDSSASADSDLQGDEAVQGAASADGSSESGDGVQGHEEGEAQDVARRVLAPDPDVPKLHKVLAQAGVGSRRDLEQMIEAGRITVNDEVAHTGQRISFGDRINVDGKAVRFRIAPPPARVLAYHKPVGEVVTHDDPQQRPTSRRRGRA